MERTADMAESTVEQPADSEVEGKAKDAEDAAQGKAEAAAKADSAAKVAPIKGAGDNALTQEEKRVGKSLKKAMLSEAELAAVNTKKGLLQLLNTKNVNVDKALIKLRYEQELEKLQIELVKLQRSVQLEGRRIAIIFEGRDAAGKGGSIRRFIEHLNPRTARVVALPKPTEVQKGQWYFQRYVEKLPNPGEIVFFDRSWYNRAVVEPVMGFCSEAEYKVFMQQVPEFEHMLYEDNLELVKFWFSISKEVQEYRFESRRLDPLKQWKISPVDEQAQENWDVYTKYKNEMFSRTHTSYAPWIIVKANDKKKARLESMRHVLSTLDYPGKGETQTPLSPDPDIVLRYHRSQLSID
jgi:polyphosphate kinase 2